MMKLFPLLFSAILMFTTTQIRANVLDDIRINYCKMASNEDLCKNTIANLNEVKDKSATHLGYLGSLQTIWANHVFSPISKLNTFNKGKKT